MPAKLARTRKKMRARFKGVMYMNALRYLIFFVLGCAVGAFGYEVLMKDARQHEIANIFTQNELNEIERFFKYRSSTDKDRYCLLYRSAHQNAYQLNLKVEGAKSGKFRNDFILGNLENFSKLIDEFNSLKKAGLKYDCENT